MPPRCPPTWRALLGLQAVDVHGHRQSAQFPAVGVGQRSPRRSPGTGRGPRKGAGSRVSATFSRRRGWPSKLRSVCGLGGQPSHPGQALAVRGRCRDRGSPGCPGGDSHGRSPRGVSDISVGSVSAQRVSPRTGPLLLDDRRRNVVASVTRRLHRRVHESASGTDLCRVLEPFQPRASSPVGDWPAAVGPCALVARIPSLSTYQGPGDRAEWRSTSPGHVAALARLGHHLAGAGSRSSAVGAFHLGVPRRLVQPDLGHNLATQRCSPPASRALLRVHRVQVHAQRVDGDFLPLEFAQVAEEETLLDGGAGITVLEAATMSAFGPTDRSPWMPAWSRPPVSPSRRTCRRCRSCGCCGLVPDLVAGDPAFVAGGDGLRVVQVVCFFGSEEVPGP